MTERVLPGVCVVVVNYNGRQYLARCLDSLKNLDYSSNALELVLVDNGSRDDSVEFVVSAYPGVKVIRSPQNNYCLANNLGCRSSGSPYVAFLNNDAWVEPGWLKALVEALESDSQAAGAGSKILFPDGRIQSAGHAALPRHYWQDRAIGDPDQGQLDRAEEVPSVSLAAALFRRSCLETVGFLDERFGAYLEDVDLALRCREAGWRLLYVPVSRAFHRHHGSFSDDQIVRLCERNRLLLLAKHAPEELAASLNETDYFSETVRQSLLLQTVPDLISVLAQGKFSPDLKKKLDGLFLSLEHLFTRASDTMKARAQAEAGDLRSHLDVERQAVACRDEEIAVLRSHLDVERQAVACRDEEIVVLRSHLDVERQAVACRDEQVALLRSSNGALEARTGELTRRLAEAETACDGLSAKIAALADQLGSERKAVVAKGIEIDGLRSSLDRAETAIAALRDSERRFKAEADDLKEEKKAFYRSRTFRLLVGPLWKIADAFKRLTGSRQGPCIGWFSALECVASPGRQSGYRLLLTNDSSVRQPVVLELRFGSISPAYQERLTLEPYSSREVGLTHVWPQNCEDGLYAVRASLRDGNFLLRDQLTIIQKVAG